MRQAVTLAIYVVFAFLSNTLGADDAARLDGTLETTVSGSNTGGALGYSFQFTFNG
jgi:hypothetical protein